MVAQLANLVHETSTTTGTGDFTTARAGGLQRGSEAFGTGDDGADNPHIFIWNENAGAAEWEIRQSYWSDANTFVRAGAPLASSNANATVDFTAGNKHITNDIPAAFQVRANAMAVGFQNAELALSVGSSALTIALKTAAGTDPSPLNPVTATFRSATAANGTMSSMQIIAATSLVISSGSTLGTTSSVAFRIWIVGFDDGGTFRLGAINCRNSTNDIYPLAGWGIASSTAEGGAGAADATHTFYTGSGVTSKAYIVLGYVTYETGLGTAGTWSAVPTRAQLFGPDVRLPGSIVQVAAMTDSTGFATTSSSYQTTTLLKAIALTSAANVVLMAYGGTFGTGATDISMWASPHRDATRLAMQFFESSDPGLFGAGGMTLMDFPGTTSSVTYSVKLKNNNNTTSVQFPSSPPGDAPYGTLVLQELVG